MIDPKEKLIEFENIYTPGSLLGVYTNAIKTPADAKMIMIRGRLEILQNQKEYVGYYFDTLKSIDENRSIKIKISAHLRSSLVNNGVYVFKGYVEKKMLFSSIELSLAAIEVYRKEENIINQVELKRFEIIQKKVERGYRDFEALVKEHIYNGKKLRIANLYGNTAIVDKDFHKGLSEIKIRFEISEFRCNFNSKAELIASSNKMLLDNFDVVAFVRGGGDKASLEIFNDPDLANTIIGVKPIVVSALGHTVDETLFDRVSDRKIALPHDYGNSLKVWVDQAIEEQSKSKSVFIDQVKKDLEKTFQDQINTLQNQLNAKNKEFGEAQLKFKELTEQNQKDKADTILARQKSFDATTKSMQEQITTIQNQLNAKNKEFGEAQLKFKELSVQINKDKEDTILASKKAFEAHVKSLTEQIKSKDESLKLIQSSNESTLMKQVAASTAELNIKNQTLTSQKLKLEKELNELSSLQTKIIFYIIIAMVLGFMFGKFFG